MPVINRKPIGDNDDEHHSKLIHRQHKNGTNNDASPVFASIPIWSTVAVQWENGGPWTHWTIVGKGDHDHHDWSYIIQVTTTGRRITCNRQHIRPISISEDEYICYQATKHANRQTIPFDALLEHINSNPMSYSNRNIQSNISNTHNTHDKQQPKKWQARKKAGTHKNNNKKTGEDNNKIQQGENCIKTRHGRTIRNPDRLSYQ